MSPLVPRCLVILGFGLWIGALWPITYWTYRDADGHQASDGQAISLCRSDLALRVVAVRRFAARTGRLPERLADCATDLPSPVAWVEEREFGSMDVEEPWCGHEALIRRVRNLDPLPAPGVDQDLFGLPVLYSKGDHPAADDWVRSDDPIPNAVAALIDREPPPSPEPFALTSPVLREFVSSRSAVRWTMALVAVFFVGTLVLLVVAASFVSRRFGDGAVGKWGRIWVRVTTVFAALAAAFGTVGSHATCYIAGRFSSRHLDPEQRRAILEEAVERGEVDPEVAARARRYIEELP